MLIDSPRLRPGDREAWKRAAGADLAWSSTSRHRQRVEGAEVEIVRFARAGDCYAGVSWGKDSVVLAHLVATLAPDVPLVWVRVEPIYSPECIAVRDAFLAAFPDAHYSEIARHCRRAVSDCGADRLPDGSWLAAGTLESGFAEAADRFGDRHLSGIRAEEAAGRERFRRAHGRGTDRASAPLIDWSAGDVFAYLAHHDLPIHPAYAMTLGGALPRERIRVASIGGKRGRGMGRREWEAAYYPDLLAGRG